MEPFGQFGSVSVVAISSHLGLCMMRGTRKRLRLDEDLKTHFVKQGIEKGLFRSAVQAARQAELWTNEESKQPTSAGAASRWQWQELQPHMACSRETLSEAAC